MYDVVIIGSGIVGLVNALLLAEQETLRIALVDAKRPQLDWSEAEYDARVYAITPASQQLFEKLQVWPRILTKRASPYIRMQVWDSHGGELTFDHASLRVPVLGHIVEENLLRGALFEKLSETSRVDFLCPSVFQSLQEQEGYYELSGSSCSSHTSLCAKLLVGADGAQSWVREQAGIGLRIHDYQQMALIAQVKTELPHLKTARQVFLCEKKFPKGPLAFLPLSEAHDSSIVWSTTASEAERLLQLEETAFQDLLSEAFAFRLGRIRSVSKRQVFPLYERHAESYVKTRVALIGDAAHTLHPLAGQGVNLGIADARALAEVIGEALQKKRDFASLPTLRRYERARRGETLVMQTTVKLLKSLFASENRGLSFVRSQGLIATNHCHPLKSWLASYAMGIYS